MTMTAYATWGVGRKYLFFFLFLLHLSLWGSLRHCPASDVDTSGASFDTLLIWELSDAKMNNGTVWINNYMIILKRISINMTSFSLKTFHEKILFSVDFWSRTSLTIPFFMHAVYPTILCVCWPYSLLALRFRKYLICIFLQISFCYCFCYVLFFSMVSKRF
jgi:hypothetical protein